MGAPPAWSGLWPKPDSGKSANSPWYSNRSLFQMPCMISIVSRTWACRRGNRSAALAAPNSPGIHPEPTPTLSRPLDRWSWVASSAASTPGARYGVSMMLMPIRTFSVLAASQGISVMPWNHLPREMTGRALGRSVIMPKGYCSSAWSEASGTMMRSRVQTESKSRSSARAVKSSSSLTVTSSRKFGRYRASFIGRPPRDDPGYRRAALSASLSGTNLNAGSTDAQQMYVVTRPIYSRPHGTALEPVGRPHREVSAARVPELAGGSPRAPVPRPRRPVGLVGAGPGPVLEFDRRLLRDRVLGAVDPGAQRRSDAAGPLVQRRPAELGPARTAPRGRRRHGAGVRPGGRPARARDYPRGPAPGGGGGGRLAAPGRRGPG